MKTIAKLTYAVILFVAFAGAKTTNAQTKADVFDASKPITWLGVDYSFAKFIGVPGSKESSNVTNEEFKDVYLLGWNYLFVNEQKKYDVAKATGRTSVTYAIDVTVKVNKDLKPEFFTSNPEDFKKITDADIAKAVSKYDFQKKEGIGMMIFVEGMSKAMDSMGMWVTFVDMKSKTVLLTTYKTGKPGGFGFRNYWAKPLYTTLKDMDSNFQKWK